MDGHGKGEAKNEMRLLAAAPELRDLVKEYTMMVSVAQNLGLLSCPTGRALMDRSEKILRKIAGEK